MIRQMTLILTGSLFALTAVAAPAPMSKTQNLFNRQQAIFDDSLLEDAKESRDVELSNRIAEKISELGLREMTAKDHGISQSEYLARKARSQFAVLYYDVRAKRDLLGAITFDFAYARGSDFFIEDERTTVVKNCKATESDGQITVNLDVCLDADAPRLALTN